jgi:ribosomal protein S27AE
MTSDVPICEKCGSQKTPKYKRRRVNGEKAYSLCCMVCAREYAKTYWRRIHGRPNPGRPKPRPLESFSGDDRLKRQWDRSNKDKRRAHKAVENALNRGDIKKEPCERCGSQHVHAHHDDYSQPLAVRWLCPVHHREHHMGAAEKSLASASQPGS